MWGEVMESRGGKNINKISGNVKSLDPKGGR